MYFCRQRRDGAVFRSPLPLLSALAFFLCLSAATACAATYYVDAASAGGDGSSWATAFKTVAQGLAAAGSGDVVEIAGGTYNGETLTASVAGVTVAGSTASGKNGTVTVKGVNGQPVLAVNAQTTWRRIVFDGSVNTDNYTVVVRINGGAPTFEQCTIGPGMQLLSIGSGGARFSRCTITGARRGTGYGQVISISSGTSPVTFDYCLFADMQFGYIQPHTASRIDCNNCLLAGFSGYVLYADTSASVTDGVHFKNCLLMANGFNPSYLIQSESAAAPVTLTRCLTQPLSPVNIKKTPQFSANVTEESPLVPGSPGLTHGRRQAYVNLGIDDAKNLGVWTQVATVANAYDIPVTLALDAAANISEADWSAIQAKVNAGNEVAAHSAHHVYLPEKKLLNVTYAGAAAAALTVTSSGTVAQTLALTVDDATVASFDLSAADYANIGKLCTAMSAVDGFSASPVVLSGTDYTSAPVLSRDLDAASVSLPQNVQISLVRNDTQFFADEITAPKDIIQGKLTAPGTSDPYVCDSFVYPFLGADAEVIAATGAAGFTAARSGYYGDYAMGGYWTGATPGGYDTLNIWSSEPGQILGNNLDAATLSRRVSALLEWAKFTGAAFALFSHGENEYTLDEWTALIDALRADPEVRFGTLQDIRAYVAANAQSHTGSTYTRTLWPDVADYAPVSGSALLGAGEAYGQTMTDFGGHTVAAGTVPAVGLYQWPGNRLPGTPASWLLLLLDNTP